MPLHGVALRAAPSLPMCRGKARTIERALTGMPTSAFSHGTWAETVAGGPPMLGQGLVRTGSYHSFEVFEVFVVQFF